MPDETKTEAKKGGFYAWTTIRIGATVEPKTGVITGYDEVKPGDSVTAKQLFPNRDGEEAQVEFDALCLSGSVRTVPFPEDYPTTGEPVSVRDFLLAKALQAQEGEFSEVNWAPGSYNADDDTINFNAVEREAQAAREGHPAMESTPTAAVRGPNTPPAAA